jgi:hypothetical protein
MHHNCVRIHGLIPCITNHGADYTKSPSQEGAQLVMLAEPVRAWIARELVEIDEEVCLAIRAGPGKDEEEVCVRCISVSGI